jgi:hypothetical protein
MLVRRCAPAHKYMQKNVLHLRRPSPPSCARAAAAAAASIWARSCTPRASAARRKKRGRRRHGGARHGRAQAARGRAARQCTSAAARAPPVAPRAAPAPPRRPAPRRRPARVGPCSLLGADACARPRWGMGMEIGGVWAGEALRLSSAPGQDGLGAALSPGSGPFSGCSRSLPRLCGASVSVLSSKAAKWGRGASARPGPGGARGRRRRRAASGGGGTGRPRAGADGDDVIMAAAAGPGQSPSRPAPKFCGPNPHGPSSRPSRTGGRRCELRVESVPRASCALPPARKASHIFPRLHSPQRPFVPTAMNDPPEVAVCHRRSIGIW